MFTIVLIDASFKLSQYNSGDHRVIYTNYMKILCYPSRRSTTHPSIDVINKEYTLDMLRSDVC